MYIDKAPLFRENVQYEEEGKKYTKTVRKYQKIDDQKTIIIDDINSPDGKTTIQNPNFGTLQWAEQDVTIPSLVNRIETIKRDIATLPIAFGWYAGTEAFKNNAYGYSAQDLEMLLIIHDKLQLADMMKKINIMIYAIAALIVLIGGGIAFYIITIASTMKK